MRAYEFTKPIEEAKVVEIVPTNEATPNLGAVAGRVGQAMGDLASKGAGAAAAMGQTLNKAKQVGSKVAKSAKAAIKKGQDKVASAILKKGSQLAIPTDGGKEEEVPSSGDSTNVIPSSSPVSSSASIDGDGGKEEEVSG